MEEMQLEPIDKKLRKYNTHGLTCNKNEQQQDAKKNAKL
jgi:hypothetical protein